MSIITIVCMYCSMHDMFIMLLPQCSNVFIAHMLFNAQYAYCVCAAQRLTCSVYVHHKKKQCYVYTRCPIASSKCMYDAECSICLLDMCMLECPLLASAVCLVCVKKKEVNLGKLGTVKLLDQNYAQDLIVMMQYRCRMLCTGLVKYFT